MFLRELAKRSRTMLSSGGGLSLHSRAFASDTVRDVVIIGGGPGGYVGAIKAAQLGLDVACVEGRGSLGGTCLNVGCIPSKALLQSSHMYAEAKNNFANHGINVAGVEVDLPKVMEQKNTAGDGLTKGIEGLFKKNKVDLPKMMEQKNTAVDGLTKGIEGLFKKNKVEYVQGWGSIKSGTEVEVTKEDGSKEIINAKNIVIATGSDVMQLPE